MRNRAAAALLLAGGLGCAGAAAGGAATAGGDYLRRVAFEVRGNEHVLLRWPERRMPLRVHLPRPPAEWFDDPQAVFEVVRDGVTDWSGAAGPDLPRFVFVDSPGDADIPIVWAAEPSGDWYVAHCVYEVDLFARHFGVAHVLVTARYPDGRQASIHALYQTMLHEMGHALGLAGHSPDPADVMYPRATGRTASGLSERDRETLRLLYARPIGHRVGGARSER